MAGIYNLSLALAAGMVLVTLATSIGRILTEPSRSKRSRSMLEVAWLLVPLLLLTAVTIAVAPFSHG